MKVLIDGRLLAQKPTGISRYTRELIESYKLRYGSSNVFVLCNRDTFYDDPNKVLTNCRPFKLLHFFRLHTEIDGEGFDIYHAPFYSGLFRKPMGTFIVVTFHDLMFWCVPGFFSANRIVNEMGRLYYYLLVRLTLRTADMVVSVSETTADDLRRICRRDSVVIPEGVSYGLENGEVSGEEKVTLAQLGLSYKGYFLYVGNNRRHKNIVFLKEAFRESGIDKKLLLAGFVDSPGGGDGIVNIERVDDQTLKLLYSGAIAFVFPSLYEGFGLPILEAIGNKTVVYSSSAGALKELSFNSVQYFNPRRTNELVELFRSWEIFSFDNEDTKRLENYRWERNFARFQEELSKVLSTNIYKAT